MNQLPIAMAITGASGAPYALRLLECLLHAGRDVELSISSSGAQVCEQELGLQLKLDAFRADQLWQRPDGQPWWQIFERPFPLAVPEDHAAERGTLHYAHYRDFMCPMASGSHRTAGMVICPCSGGTLGGIAHGQSGNLIERAAEVHLKEGRPLILVTRETPLSRVALRNMQWAAAAGATILPAMPGWYHGVRSLHDLVDFVVARILDQLGIEHSLMRRWGESS